MLQIHRFLTRSGREGLFVNYLPLLWRNFKVCGIFFPKELRASTKKRDEIILEVAGLREDAKHRSHQIESLSQELFRKQEEIEKLTRECNDKEIKLEERERVLQLLE